MAPRHRAVRSRLVTLSSDLGFAYAAQMKAVLAHRLPLGAVVDLAHDLPPHGIRESAFLVRAMARGFPAGSVHVVVVDPGVGGRRASIVVATRDGSRLVGPDNGVLAPLAEALGDPLAYAIRADRVRAAPRVGTTFDGRDLFAPTAAFLAEGGRPSAVGPSVAFERLRFPPPEPLPSGGRGEVLFVDHFGNLITNIPTDWVPSGTHQVRVRLGRRGASRTLRWATSYESIGRGRLGALGSSFGLVEVAAAEGRAAERLGAAGGTPVAITWSAGVAFATASVNTHRARERTGPHRANPHAQA